MREGPGEDQGYYIPPRCVEDESINGLAESGRVEEGEENEAGADEGEARSDTLGSLEVVKLPGSQRMGHC